MTNLKYDEGPPFIDDGQDVEVVLPSIYSKNGDLFLRIDSGYGQSIINMSVINGAVLNG